MTSRVPSAEAVVAKARRVAVTGVAARRGFTAVPKVARCLSDLTAVRETAAAAEVIQAAMLFDVLRGQKGGGSEKCEEGGFRYSLYPLTIDPDYKYKSTDRSGIVTVGRGANCTLRTLTFETKDLSIFKFTRFCD